MIHPTTEGRSETTSVPQDHPSQASITPLGRLRHDPTGQAAWSDFAARYRPGILERCRRWRLQESTAQDAPRLTTLVGRSGAASSR
jgi:hypothetical protein